MFRKNRKALSPVIASIILIAVTVAVAVVTAAWMGGITIGLMGNVETATITNLDFSTPDHIVVTVHNTGNSEVTINTAYLDAVAITTTIPALPTAVAKSASRNIDCSIIWVSGTEYTVKLTTSKGNNLLFTARANPTAVNPSVTQTPTPTPTSTPTPTPQVTYVSAGTGSASTGNPTPTYPGSLQSGDLILLQIVVMDISNTPTTPAGFTVLYGPDQSGISDDNRGRQWIYYRFSPGSQSGSITVTIAGSEVKLARMYAFRNVALSSFNEGGGFLAENGDIIDAPSVTTTGDKRLAVAFVFVANPVSVGSFTGESNGDWTEAVSEFKTTTGDDGCIQLQTATMATIGTISGGGYDTGSNNYQWGLRAFALNPR